MSILSSVCDHFKIEIYDAPLVQKTGRKVTCFHCPRNTQNPWLMFTDYESSRKSAERHQRMHHS